MKSSRQSWKFYWDLKYSREYIHSRWISIIQAKTMVHAINCCSSRNMCHSLVLSKSFSVFILYFSLPIFSDAVFPYWWRLNNKRSYAKRVELFPTLVHNMHCTSYIGVIRISVLQFYFSLIFFFASNDAPWCKSFKWFCIALKSFSKLPNSNWENDENFSKLNTTVSKDTNKMRCEVFDQNLHDTHEPIMSDMKHFVVKFTDKLFSP